MKLNKTLLFLKQKDVMVFWVILIDEYFDKELK